MPEALAFCSGGTLCSAALQLKAIAALEKLSHKWGCKKRLSLACGYVRRNSHPDAETK